MTVPRKNLRRHAPVRTPRFSEKRCTGQKQKSANQGSLSVYINGQRTENTLVKRGGLYKSQKRKKEILRQKKQEEKRKRRLNKHTGPQQDTEENTGSREEEEPS